MPDDLADLRQIAGRLLYRNDILVLCELQRSSSFDVARSAARYVVDDDRRLNRVGNCTKVGDDSALRWFVVHRRSMEQVRRAGGFHLARQGYRFLRVVRGCSRNYWDSPGGLLDRYLDHVSMLVDGHRRGLARRATGNQEVDPASDLPVDEGAQRALVDLAGLGEGRDERGSTAGESLRVHPLNVCGARRGERACL